MDYLQKRGKGRYYFRIRVPADLRRWFPREDISKSLKVRRYEMAKGPARLMLHKAERLFTTIRSGLMTEAEIRELVSKYLNDALKDSSESIALGIGVSPDPERHADLIEANEGLLIEYREALACGNTGMVFQTVNDH